MRFKQQTMYQSLAVLSCVLLAAVTTSGACAAATSETSAVRTLACQAITGPGLPCLGSITAQPNAPVKIAACAVKFRAVPAGASSAQYRYGATAVLTNDSSYPITEADAVVFGVSAAGRESQLFTITFKNVPPHATTPYGATLNGTTLSPTVYYHILEDPIADTDLLSVFGALLAVFRILRPGG